MNSLDVSLILALDWHKHHATPCVVISKVIDKYSMIADGLRSLHDSMVNVRQGYQATKRSMQQGVDDLGYRVKSTGRKIKMICNLANSCNVGQNRKY